jgi:hypothetical protein
MPIIIKKHLNSKKYTTKKVFHIRRIQIYNIDHYKDSVRDLHRERKSISISKPYNGVF